MPLSAAERAAFLRSVKAQRARARTQLHFAPDEPLSHYPQAAVDRRALRDALVEHDLLRILPRHPKRGRRRRSAQDPQTQGSVTQDRAAQGGAMTAAATPNAATRDAATRDAATCDAAAQQVAARARATKSAKKSPPAQQADGSAGRILLATTALPTVGSAPDSASPEPNHAASPGVPLTTEEAHSSTDKPNASGQD